MIKAFFKKIFSFNIDIKEAFIPFVGLRINSLGDYSGTKEGVKRDTPIIISLTSKREHFDILPITIYSLLNQTLKPDRIILWLDNESEDLTYLPYNITQFIKNGLEIKFIKNLGNYNKTIYPIKEFRDSIIVTTSDNIYYPKNWLNKLYLSYITNPEDIHIHKAYKVIHTKELSPKETWPKATSNEKAQYDNYPDDIGGILYPPNCFSKEALREDIFLKYAPTEDVSWFWIMALVHNKKFRIVKNNISNFIKTDRWNFCLKKKEIEQTLSVNQQISNLLVFYKQNILHKLKK